MSTSNNYELLLMSVNKRTKKLTFWVHPILMKKQQQGGFHGLIQELKLVQQRVSGYILYPDTLCGVGITSEGAAKSFQS